MTEALTEAQEVRWSSESMCWRMATPHNHMISKVWVFSPEGNTGWTAFRWCSLMSGSLHYTVITGSYIWVTSPQEQEAWHESIQCLHTSFLQPQSDRQAPDLEKLEKNLEKLTKLREHNTRASGVPMTAPTYHCSTPRTTLWWEKP